jgi:hypothetical protein
MFLSTGVYTMTSRRGGGNGDVINSKLKLQLVPSMDERATDLNNCGRKFIGDESATPSRLLYTKKLGTCCEEKEAECWDIGNNYYTFVIALVLEGRKKHKNRSLLMKKISKTSKTSCKKKFWTTNGLPPIGRSQHQSPRRI